MSLWGAHVSETKPLTLANQENPLVINRAALVSGTEAVLKLEIDGDTFVLGTLKKQKSLILDVNLFEEAEKSYRILVSGKDSAVDLTGYVYPSEEDEEATEESEDALQLQDLQESKIETPTKTKSKKDKEKAAKEEKPKEVETPTKEVEMKENSSKKKRTASDVTKEQKSPKSEEKPPAKKQKTEGAFKCDKCDRTFASEAALTSHSKAKHA
jgi:outer membrane biosynthesis protein TonB